MQGPPARSGNLAGVYFDLGELERAQALIEEAAESFECRLGPDHLDVAWATWLLALVRGERGDGPGEVAAWTKVMRIRQASSRPVTPTSRADGWRWPGPIGDRERSAPLGRPRTGR